MSVPYLRWGAPSAAIRLTWHSLRIDGPLCCRGRALRRPDGLSVPGAILEGLVREPAAARPDFPCRDPNDPPQKGDWTR